MLKKYYPIYDWSWQAASHIRHPLDRPAVMRELDGHIDDRIEAYMEAGLSHDVALEKALAAMGDPHETGQALARVHTPWLSMLLTGSMCLFLLSILLAFQLMQSGRIANSWYAADTDLTDREITNLENAEAMRREQSGFTPLPSCTLWEGLGYTITLDNGYTLHAGPNGLLWAEISVQRRPWHPFPLGFYHELAFYDGQGNTLTHTWRFIDRDTAAYTVRLEEDTTQVTVEYAFGQAAFSHLLKGGSP